MTRTVIDKVIELIVVLFVVSIGTFALVSLIPGDPSVAMLGEGRSPEEYAQARADMGLNDPSSRGTGIGCRVRCRAISVIRWCRPRVR